MSSPTKCVFCGNSATLGPVFDDRHRQISCQVCGNYSITGTAEAIVGHKPIQNPGAVSGWIRQQNAMGITPHIDDDVDRLRALKKPAFRERTERYLLAVADRTSRIDEPTAAMSQDLMGISYSDHPNELYVILKYLEHEGLVSRRGGAEETRTLTPKGYIAADDLRTKRAASSQAFVAMSFSEEMKLAYDRGFEPGIRNAGFQPMRLLDKEHANKIDDEIIAEIRPASRSCWSWRSRWSSCCRAAHRVRPMCARGCDGATRISVVA
jgi:DNA-binding PadR family transcriptional regulator